MTISTPEGVTMTIDGDDELLVEVIAFVRESGRASTSAVQRKFKINYNRAARLIESMQVKGIVSAMNEKGARTIL
ncbi:DNA translocase FtsK [Pseudomonas sp. MPR-ANC1]|uniref:DNA translocase FtsK n=1 Tax=Pseudomonas sp. MPR-ANC1 TaxID=2075548 RepID=UPI002114BD77